MSKKFSICFVCPEGYPVLSKSNHIMAGGAELQQVLLAKGLAKKGYDVSFLAGDYGQPKIEYIEGVKVIRSYKVGYGNRKLRFVPDLKKICSAMKIANSDIYFQRCVFHQTGKVAIFAMLHKKKFVFSSGHEFNAYPASELKGLNPIYKYSYIWAIRRANLILCQNYRQQQNFLKYYNLYSHIVPNLAEDSYSASIKKNQDAKTIILWVGTFSERKQPLLFAELAPHFKECEFWMVGIPRDQRLLDTVQECGRRYNNLKIIGFVPQNEIHKYFSQADFFVSTASSEGFPNTFLQAMAHSIPIVSLNVNPDEVLEKSGCGVACNGNFDRMVSLLAGLLKNEEKMIQMGEKGKKYVMRHHHPDVVIPLYEKLFCQSLGIPTE